MAEAKAGVVGAGKAGEAWGAGWAAGRAGAWAAAEEEAGEVAWAEDSAVVALEGEGGAGLAAVAWAAAEEEAAGEGASAGADLAVAGAAA